MYPYSQVKESKKRPLRSEPTDEKRPLMVSNKQIQTTNTTPAPIKNRTSCMIEDHSFTYAPLERELAFSPRVELYS